MSQCVIDMLWHVCLVHQSCVAVFCYVLQFVAMFCNVLQCVADMIWHLRLVCQFICCSVSVCCSMLQCVAVYGGDNMASTSGPPVYVLQCFAVCCSVLQCVADVIWHLCLFHQSVNFSVFLCATACCSVFQCVPVSCSVLQI